METREHLINTNGQGIEIHEFIDQYWEKFKEDHRVVLHHGKGIEYIVKKFGEYARTIIMQHLKDDQYGTVFRGIPKDQNDPIFKGYTDKFEDAKQYADKLLSEA
jgi:hypothetical protein